MVAVHVEIDQSGVFSMVKTFTTQLHEAEIFALKEIERVIRFRVFTNFVEALCDRAGPGWPSVYTHHLTAFMSVNVPIIAQSLGDGKIVVQYDLDGLGDYKDLEAGAHHQALIDFELGEFGTTASGKAKGNPHPPKVDLPYVGQPLYNDKERRQEFWETAVVAQQPFETGFKRGKGYLIIDNAPSYEEVALARVSQAWIPMGKAPEWLWLENGFNESEPRIYSVDFTRSLELVTECIASRIYEGAIISLVKIAEEAGEAVGVGSAGRVYSVSSGRFVNFRDTLDSSVPDYGTCFGSI